MTRQRGTAELLWQHEGLSLRCSIQWNCATQLVHLIPVAAAVGTRRQGPGGTPRAAGGWRPARLDSPAAQIVWVLYLDNLLLVHEDSAAGCDVITRFTRDSDGAEAALSLQWFQRDHAGWTIYSRACTCCQGPCRCDGPAAGCLAPRCCRRQSRGGRCRCGCAARATVQPPCHHAGCSMQLLPCRLCNCPV